MSKREKRVRPSERAKNVILSGAVSLVALLVAYAVTRDAAIYTLLCYVGLVEVVGFAVYKLVVL